MNFEKMFHTIDTHVAGEAFRVVTHSPIKLDGNDIHDKNTILQNQFSMEKNLLLNEPRGHRGMHGCIVLPSSLADIALLFFHHDDVCSFKYEGVFATITALIETGNLKKTADNLYRVETINGIYKVEATIENNEVTSTYVESGRCNVVESNSEYQLVQIDGLRNYVLITLPESVPSIELENLAALNEWGNNVTTKLSKGNVDYDGVVLVEAMEGTEDKVRSITFEKDGYILRSPGIDSTFAIMSSILETNKDLTTITNESIFGSTITAEVLSNTGYQYSVKTEAFITGTHQFIFDQEDPLKNGFLLT